MKLYFSRTIYPKSAVIKAAYMFTDRAFIHLDADNESFIVDLEMKNPDDKIISKDFENELISQTARYVIGKKTKTIREMMIARAVASSILVNEDFKDDSYEDEEETDVDGMLADWFDRFDSNENNKI